MLLLLRFLLRLEGAAAKELRRRRPKRSASVVAPVSEPEARRSNHSDPPETQGIIRFILILQYISIYHNYFKTCAGAEKTFESVDESPPAPFPSEGRFPDNLNSSQRQKAGIGASE